MWDMQKMWQLWPFMVTMATWFNITDWLYGRGLWPHGGLEVPIQMEKKNGHGHFIADYSDTYEAILWTLYLRNSLIAPLFLTFNNVHIDNDSFIAWTTISWGFFLWVLFQRVVWCNKRWANKHDDWLLSQPALHWANVVSKHNDQQHRTAAGISWITSSLLQ